MRAGVACQAHPYYRSFNNVQPGITSYSFTLLHNRLIGLVHELADQASSDSAKDTGVTALAVITLADAVIEMAINATIETTFLPQDIRKGQESHVAWRHQTAHERLMTLRPPLDRLKKLAGLFALSVDWSADEPWVSAKELHEVRNSLAHYRSGPVQSSNPKTETFPNRSRLEPIAKKLGTWRKLTDGGTWLEMFLDPTCAQWAYETADGVLRTLESSDWNKILR